MAENRNIELCIAQKAVPLSCFVASVSMVKTNLIPVDYVEFLDAAASEQVEGKTLRRNLLQRGGRVGALS